MLVKHSTINKLDKLLYKFQKMATHLGVKEMQFRVVHSKFGSAIVMQHGKYLKSYTLGRDNSWPAIQQAIVDTLKENGKIDLTT